VDDFQGLNVFIMPLEAGDITGIAAALKNLQGPAVQAVALKLPEFWTDKPEVWFARVESQFGTKAITVDKTKFDYVVSSLDTTTAGEVEAILLNPPENDKYNSLKTALLAAFGKTQAQKDSELLSITGLGDVKPSALLRRLQSLNNDPATLFRAHFLALLPSEVRSVLAGQDIPQIADLAKAADRVMEARGFDSHVSPVEVQAVRAQNTRRPPNQQGGGDVERGNKKSDHICFYHIRYGKDAHRCQPWCLLNDSVRGQLKNNGPKGGYQGNSSAGRQ
jgi:hypothetical protein